MVPTLIITEVMLVLAVAFVGRHRREAARLEDMRMAYAILACLNFTVAALWLYVILRRGQFPTFDLAPVIAAGIVFTGLAFRANQLFHKQGKGPAR